MSEASTGAMPHNPLLAAANSIPEDQLPAPQLPEIPGEGRAEDAEQSAEEGEAFEQAPDQEDQQEQAQSIVEAAGLRFDDLAAEFTENGELSEESYAKLEAAGIPRELVDSYIEGQQIRATAIREQIFAPVGGVEGYERIATWAASALAQTEIEAFNATLQSGDPARVTLALVGLHGKYIEATGKRPRLVEGESSTSGDGGAYKSRAELVADMKDPRYKKDEAYRKQVYEKLSRSRLV